MDKALRTLLEQAIEGLSFHMDGLRGGQLSVDAWQQGMAEDLIVFHYAAYMAATGEQTLDAETRRRLNARIGEQIDYLNRFADDLEARDGELTERDRARATLYAASIKATYSMGKTVPWSLPFHPADGSAPCLGNCRCSWDVSVLDAERGDADARWVLGGTEDHCPVCPARAARIYSIRGGHLQ